MTRHLLLLIICALTLTACIPAGGGGGGDDDDRGVDEADRGAPDPDDGVPPPDGSAPDPDDGIPPPDGSAPDPDDGIPPPDGSAPDPDDGIPPPDRGLDPDQDVTPADRGVEPDQGGCGEERCNGRDDDCDDRFDEDFPTLGQPCSVGQGACRVDAAIVCTLDGRGVTCDAVLEAPEDEVCNGTDDDCDGRTDEDTAGGACLTGEPGRCGPGALACQGGAPICNRSSGPRAEQCEGSDDDCDGAVDEGVCGPAVEQNCQDGIDNDRDGSIDCLDIDCEDRPECAGEVEQCDNGVDDDGDGFVDCDDDDCADRPECEIVAAPECMNHVELFEADRNEAYRVGDVLKCDNDDTVVPGSWHRFTGPAGNRMPTEAPPENACGTHAPGWMQGAHPRVADGIVQRLVCFHYFGDTCNWEARIRVRNCGPFYVYELPPTPVCSLRYCGTGSGPPVDPEPVDRVAGVQQNVARAAILARGWRECHRSAYNAAGARFADIRAACNGAELMLACGRTGNNTHILAAEGPAADVFFNVGGAGDVSQPANGVEWYYAPNRSFGFAPGGAAINLNSCDTIAGATRMCVHLNGGDLLGAGYRCGDNALNGDGNWQRVIYTR